MTTKAAFFGLSFRLMFLYAGAECLLTKVEK